MIIGGPVLYDFADTAEVMRWCRELLPSLPEELSSWLGLITVPPAPPFPEELQGRKACTVIWCYTGPHDRADEVLAPGQVVRVTAGHRPASDAVHRAAERVRRSLPGRAAMVLEGTLLHRDLGHSYRRAPQVRRATAHRALHHAPVPDRRRGQPGAAGRHRVRLPGRRVGGRHPRRRPRPGQRRPMSQWARDYWEALRPTSAGGGYINFMMSEGHDPIVASYRRNYDRLARIKARYDPGNSFHVNQNIQPASQAGA
jgi:Berberine and berberine like